ncbi:MAG: DUF4019 domain-containing protein [Kiritimatiellae bacterium]|nr:DUF4019 domain-containing protein [Kiritimatiellia bacterium]
MKYRAPIVLALVLAGLAGCARQPRNPEAEQAAEAAATTWLELTDGKKYDESWDAAAGYFKNAVAREEWQKQLRAHRDPLGAMKSRTCKSRRYMTTLPGAPDGKYVVLQFASSFEHKKNAAEFVTAMQDKDAVWRVSGYYIK